MLMTTSHIKDFTIHACDGEIGSVAEFYFDDETWTIRYMVVNTGSWLFGRQVLISPIFLRRLDRDAKRLYLSLTKKQIEDSPAADTQQPVSRQWETEYMNYHAVPYYWDGSDIWGGGPIPLGLIGPVTTADAKALAAKKQKADPHLRSTAAVTGYHVAAVDGQMGHVDDFVLDADTWTVRYLEVNTSNWWPGKKVLMSPEWIESISWLDSKICIHLLRETIKSAPEYIESRRITRDYEVKLHEHYGRRPYCIWEAATQNATPPHAAL